jgi:hypothetical protein
MGSRQACGRTLQGNGTGDQLQSANAQATTTDARTDRLANVPVRTGAAWLPRRVSQRGAAMILRTIHLRRHATPTSSQAPSTRVVIGNVNRPESHIERLRIWLSLWPRDNFSRPWRTPQASASRSFRNAVNDFSALLVLEQHIRLAVGGGLTDLGAPPPHHRALRVVSSDQVRDSWPGRRGQCARRV